MYLVSSLAGVDPDCLAALSAFDLAAPVKLTITPLSPPLEFDIVAPATTHGIAAVSSITCTVTVAIFGTEYADFPVWGAEIRRVLKKHKLVLRRRGRPLAFSFRHIGQPEATADAVSRHHSFGVMELHKETISDFLEVGCLHPTRLDFTASRHPMALTLLDSVFSDCLIRKKKQ